MTTIGKLLEEIERISHQMLENTTVLSYNNYMESKPISIQEKKKKWIKRTYVKTTKQEKAILDSKIRQSEYFMEGEHTATMRTANYLYLVELFNVDDLIEVQVLKKRKIK